MDHEFTTEKLGDSRSLVTLSGRITAVNNADIKKKIQELVDTGSRELVFDLSGVSFMDSSGLAAFVSAMKKTREAGGWIKLAALPELTRSIFTLTQLDRVIDLYPDVKSALRSTEKS